MTAEVMSRKLQFEPFSKQSLSKSLRPRRATTHHITFDSKRLPDILQFGIWIYGDNRPDFFEISDLGLLLSVQGSTTDFRYGSISLRRPG